MAFTRALATRRSLAIALVGLAALGAAALSANPSSHLSGNPPPQRAAAVTGELELAPCHLAGLAEEVRCGVLEVWEDRAAGRGRTIPLHVAVLPTWARQPAPDPLFLLAGGPGQGARDSAALAARFFRQVRRERDIVLVDLRGTGASGALDCELAGDDLALISGRGFFPVDVAACRDRLQADPRLYTSETAMADLDQVRSALGYERINLWGGSYGTRAALVYARMFAPRLRSVVMDGAVPLDLSFPLSTAADAQRALDRLFDDCALEAACHAEFPHPRAELAALLDELERRPVELELVHPRTGEPRAVRIDRAGFAGALRGFLYSTPHASLIPLVVREARRGNFGPLAALTSQTAAWSVETMSLGLTMSVLCSEDVPRIDPGEIAAATAGTFVGTADIETWQRYCADWPHGPLPAGDLDRKLPAEALILSGGLDPVTPPRWGERMLQSFPAGRHVVVDGAAHNTSFSGCLPDLIAAFYQRGSARDLDVSCAAQVRRPPFVVRATGTEP